MTVKTPSRTKVSVEFSVSSDEDEISSGSEPEITQEAHEPSENESTNEDADDTTHENAAWADSIAKILKCNKPKNKKTLVLSKAKKHNELPKPKPKVVQHFQVQAEDGTVKQLQESSASEEEKEDAEGVPRKKRKDVVSLRKKPHVLERDRERLLAKIATKGVVQLFNSVKQQQKDIETKLRDAGPLEVRRDKVLKSIDKRSFLDHLMGKSSSVNVDKQILTESQESTKNGSTWGVLRDDFMMASNKMKDWNKQVEEEEEETCEMEVESD